MNSATGQHDISFIPMPFSIANVAILKRSDAHLLDGIVICDAVTCTHRLLRSATIIILQAKGEGAWKNEVFIEPSNEPQDF